MDMRRLIWLVTEKVKLEAMISQNRGHDLDLVTISGIADNLFFHPKTLKFLNIKYLLRFPGEVGHQQYSISQQPQLMQFSRH